MKIFFSVFISMTMAMFTFAQSNTPQGKLSGVIFGDYYYSAARDTSFSQLKNTAIPGANGVHGMQIRRINLAYDYSFSDRLSTRIRLESDEANFTVNSSDKYNRFGMFVKDAYIKWGIFKGHDLSIGIQSPPAYEISETVWGNRFIEKTIMDLRGVVSSRDFGLALRGNLNSKGSLKYWIMYANNSAGKPEMDNYKRMYGHIELTPMKNLSLTAYADYQTKAEIINKYDSSAMLNNDVITYAFFAGYKVKDKYTFGVEAYANKANHGYDNQSALIDRSGMGLSAFGTYTLNSHFEVLARYDYFEPNGDANAKGDTRGFLIAGIKYRPEKNFIIAPNVVVETYEASSSRTYKSSVTPRITFSANF